MDSGSYFNEAKLAERWGMSLKTLQRWRVIRIGPLYSKNWRSCFGIASATLSSTSKPRLKIAMKVGPTGTLEWVSRFNHRRLLEPIGYIPPAEAGERYYQQIALQAIPA